MLQLNVFQNRAKVDISLSKRLNAVALERNLQIPSLDQPLPLRNHCVSMSLNFIHHYHKTKNIAEAARILSSGADQKCAEGTLLYRALLKHNMPFRGSRKAEEFLFDIRSVVAKAFDLAFNEEWQIKEVPAKEMLDLLNDKLEKGDYVICFPNHLAALIKDEAGNLFLYDPNVGTTNLLENPHVFLDLLVKYNIHLTETLSLFRVRNHIAKESLPCEQIFVTKTEPATLAFEEKPGRWGVAVFQWRGKTHRFIRDQCTHMIYNGDSKKLIRLKCFLLSGRTMIIDTTIRTIYHVAMAVFGTLALPFQLARGRVGAAAKVGRSYCDIIRAPFYGVLATGAALYGILKPYEGRRLYGYFERCLNRQNHRVSRREKYYLAPCFVPLNFNRKEVISCLKRAVLWRQYAKEQVRFK